MLEVCDVSKRFGELQVLHPTSLVVETGRTAVLIGPSGCGKSTLLRMIIGLLTPDTGVIRLDGQDLTPRSAAELRRKMGYVIQDGGLFPHLSAASNVTLMARYLGWDAPRVRARLDELSGLVRLPSAALEKFPSQLSGGQRQRVGIMRALMLDPSIILLDEPLGALDPLVRFDLQEDLRSIFRLLKKTVVLVTHDMGEAGFFGDTVALLGSGRIVQQGTFAELVGHPADDYVSRFVNAQRLPQLTHD